MSSILSTFARRPQFVHLIRIKWGGRKKLKKICGDKHPSNFKVSAHRDIQNKINIVCKHKMVSTCESGRTLKIQQKFLFFIQKCRYVHFAISHPQMQILPSARRCVRAHKSIILSEFEFRLLARLFNRELSTNAFQWFNDYEARL